ncbi:hypothetical protein [Glutamicibacter sp.]|jgi:hypothetical protein|uniref:hypothetical protein n=1 Tax=Glutamicibacter sp. TaxID=1931995 RepID=UPI002FDB2A15
MPVDPLSLALAGTMGAARMGQKAIGLKGEFRNLRYNLKRLRTQRQLLQGSKAALEEQASGARGKLISQRGLYGPNTEQQRLDTMTERARAVLAARERDINFAIKEAKRKKRLRWLNFGLEMGGDAAATGLGINELSGGDEGGGGHKGSYYEYLGPR